MHCPSATPLPPSKPRKVMIMSIDYNKVFEQAYAVVDKCSKEILQSGNSVSVQYKGEANYVTNFDVSVENYLKSNLASLVEGAFFVCEESEPEPLPYSGYCWIIDPIDGTTNFLHGLPDFAISVSLAEIKGGVLSPKLAIVYAPRHYVSYCAISGQGSLVVNLATKKKKPLKTSSTSTLKGSLVAFGLPYNRNNFSTTYNAIEKLSKYVDDIKRIGPSSMDICRVAQGSLDAYFEPDMHAWDIAGGILVLEEAGGKHNVSLTSRNIRNSILVIATNGKLNGAIEDVLAESSKFRVQ
jgi:myo-inositol-1(or 4)-monophosphatase